MNLRRRTLDQGVVPLGLAPVDPLAAEGMPFPWRWDDGMISAVLKTIWEMSAHMLVIDHRGTPWLDNGVLLLLTVR